MSVSWTKPRVDQLLRHIKAQIDAAETPSRRCVMIIQPLLNSRSTPTDVAVERDSEHCSKLLLYKRILTRYRQIATHHARQSWICHALLGRRPPCQCIVDCRVGFSREVVVELIGHWDGHLLAFLVHGIKDVPWGCHGAIFTDIGGRCLGCRPTRRVDVVRCLSVSAVCRNSQVMYCQSVFISLMLTLSRIPCCPTLPVLIKCLLNCEPCIVNPRVKPPVLSEVLEFVLGVKNLENSQNG